MGRTALLISLFWLMAASVPAQEPTATVRLDWTGVTGAGGYKAEIRDASGRIVVAETVKEPAISAELLPGEYELRVTTLNRFMQPSGSSAWTPFRVLRRKPPIVSSVSPKTVIPKEGGTLILRGAEFGEDTTVAIGGGNQGILETALISATELRVKLSASIPKGSYDLIVTNRPSLSFKVASAFAIRYPDPVPRSASPAVLDFDAADRTATINGNSYYEDIGAFLVKGGKKIAAPAERLSGTAVRIKIPENLEPGVWDVELENDSASNGRLTGALTIVPAVPYPVLNSIAPEILVAGSAEKIHLLGSGFCPDTRILVGDRESTAVNFISAVEIEFTAPANAAPGSYTVSAENRKGRTGKLDRRLRLRQPDPIPIVLEPARLEFDDPARTATLKGVKFVVGGSVELVSGIGAVSVDVHSVKENAIEMTIPVGLAEGKWSLRVRNDEFSLGLLDSALTILPAIPYPAIVNITPTRLDPESPTAVSIAGSGFTADSRAMLSDGTRLETLFFSTTRLQCVVPARESGPPLGIIVVNPRERKAIFSNAIQVRYETPRITAVLPTALEIDSTDRRLRISGGPFNANAEIELVQGNRILSPKLVDRRTDGLAFDLPSDAGTGVWIVSVANDAYSQARLDSAFTVLPAVPTPRIAALELEDADKGLPMRLAVRGSGFKPETAIVIGNGAVQPLASRFVSDALIDLSLDAGAVGEFAVEAVTRTDRRSVYNGKLVIAPFPVIGEVWPTRLDPGLPTTVSISGSGFTAASRIELMDGAENGAADSIKLETVFVSPTELRCVIPVQKSSPPFDVAVINTAVRRAEAVNALQCRYETPRIIGILPTTLETDSSDRRLRITGGPFSADAEIELVLGNKTLNPKQVDRRPDGLAFNLPSEAGVGIWTVSISNDAYSISRIDNAFTVLPAVPTPRIAALELEDAPEGLSMRLAVRGSDLKPETVIVIGNGAVQPLASRFVSDALIETILPAGAVGDFTVEAITRTDRRSVYTGKLCIASFPVIGEVSPTRLDPGLPTTVFISGSGFTAASRVELMDGAENGTADNAADSIKLETVFVSPTELRCVIPAQKSSPPFDVAVINTAVRRAEAVNALQCRYETPRITGISPITLETDSTDRRLRIAGGPFSAEAIVELTQGNKTLNPKRIECRTDGLTFDLPSEAGTGVWTVTVANDAYSISRIENAFTVLPAVPTPRIAALELEDVAEGLPMRLAVRGSDFKPETGIVIGGGALKPIASGFVSDALIELSLDAGAVGEFAVEAVTRTDRQSVYNGKLVIAPFPVIGEVWPTRLDPGLPTTVSISGSGFTAASRVELRDGAENGAADNAADSIKLETVFVSPTELRCVIPAQKSSPPFDVAVINTAVRRAKAVNALQTRWETPRITGVLPTVLEKDSTDRRLRISGGPFNANAEIELVQGNRILSPKLIDRRTDELTFDLPSDAGTGVWIVSVANDAYSQARLDSAFTVLPAVPTPRIAALELEDAAEGLPMRLAVRGSGFKPETAIVIGNGAIQPLASRFVSDALIETILPVGAVGDFTVEAITRTDRRSVYTGKLGIAPFPNITSLSPTRLDPGQIATVSIFGSGFIEDSATELSDGSRLRTILLSQNQLLCVVPARQSGLPLSIAVVNTAVRRAEAINALQCRYETPRITGISPIALETDSTDRRLRVSGGPFAADAAVELVQGDRKLTLAILERRADGLIAELPAQAGLGVWTLTAANDAYSAARLNAAFIVLPAVPTPRVFALELEDAAEGSPMRLAVRGLGFQPETAVVVGGGAVRLVATRFVSDALIETTLPADAVGEFAVEAVTRSDRRSAYAGKLLISPIPAIAIVSPHRLEPGQRSTVSVIGSGFTAASCAELADGTRLETDFVSPTELRCVVPARASGPPIGIVVANTALRRFRYEAALQTRYETPVLAGVSPAALEADAADRRIVISGGPFSAGAYLELLRGNERFPLTIRERRTDEIIAELTGEAGLGDWSLQVANDPYSTAKLEKAIAIIPAVPKPRVTALELEDAAKDQPMRLAVRGAGFRPETAIVLGDGASKPLASRFASDGLIELTLSADLVGEFAVEAVTRSDRRSAYDGKLAIAPYPTISEVSPTRLDPGLPATVSIIGTGFTAVTYAELADGTRLETVFVSPTELRCIVPARESGPLFGITVLNTATRQSELADALQTRHETPILSTIAPITFQADTEERRIVITGDKFSPEIDLVFLQGNTVLRPIILDKAAVRIVAELPKDAGLGDWALRAANDVYAFAELAAAFTVLPAVPKPEPIVLTVLEYRDPKESAYNLDKAIWTDFQTANPSLLIQKETLVGEAYDQRMRECMDSGNLPDLFFMWTDVSSRSTDIYEGHYAKDLRPLLGDDYLKNFYDYAMDSEYQSGGYLASIKQNYQFWTVFFVNKKLLADNGFSIPTSYQDLAAMVPIFSAKNIKTFMLPASGLWPVDIMLFSTIAARLLPVSFIDDLYAGRARLTDGIFVDVLKFFASMYTDGVLSTSDFDITQGKGPELFAGGQAATFVGATYQVSSFLTRKDGKALIPPLTQANDFEIIPFPALPGELNSGLVNGMGGFGFGISDRIDPGSEKEKAAVTLYKHLYSVESQKRQMGMHRLLPSRKDITDPGFDPLMTKMLACQASVRASSNTFHQKLDKSVNNVISSGLRDIGLGKAAPEQVATKAQAALEAILPVAVADSATFAEIDGKAYTADEYAALISASISGRKPNYEDDFENPKSGWETGKTYRFLFFGQTGDRGYIDGEYSVAANGSENIGGRSPRTPNFVDYVLETDFRFMPGAERLDWKFEFTESKPAGRCILTFMDYGMINITFHEDSQVGGSTIFNGFLNLFDRTTVHRFRLVVKNQQAMILLDGKLVGEIPKNQFPLNIESGFSVRFSNGSKEGAYVRFDNLKIWDISNLVTQATATGSSEINNVAMGAPISKEVLVEGGTFLMGSETGDNNEKPVHKVTVSSFWMMTTEVTQRDYESLSGNNPSGYKGGNLPVETVSWYDAISYANRLSELEGFLKAYTIDGLKVSCNWNANGWRLPTEAEWEFAARGGIKSMGFMYAGSNDADTVAWYANTTSMSGTKTVATKVPNELGLFDMSGNVREWCWNGNPYTIENQINPREKKYIPALRGGHWASGNRNLYTTARYHDYEGGKSGIVGFRLVRTAAADAQTATAVVSREPPTAAKATPQEPSDETVRVSNASVLVENENFAEPFLEYIGTVKPDFEDSFTTPAGWIKSSRSDQPINPGNDGVMNLYLYEGDNNTKISQRNIAGGNFVFSFDVKLYSNNTNYFRLWWRDLGNDLRYRLAILPYGSFIISSYDESGLYKTLAHCSASANPLDNFVNVCLIVAGNDICLRVEGQTIALVSDSGKTVTSDIAFFYSFGDTSATEKTLIASIDNVAFWNLDKYTNFKLDDFSAGMALAVDGRSCLQKAGKVTATAPPGIKVQAGATYLISAAGSVGLIPNTSSASGPDGNVAYPQKSPADGSAKTAGIATLTSPEGSLIGVFLADDQPSPWFLPADLVIPSRATLVSNPKLRQPFYIGSGPDVFTAPEGATRLYFGINDTSAWDHNTGEYIATIEEAFKPDTLIADTDVATGLIGKYYSVGTYGDGIQDAVSDDARNSWNYRFTRTDSTIDYPIEKQFWPLGYDHAFVVEWTGLLKVDKAGLHKFRVNTFNRARFYIDGILVLASLDIPNTPISKEINLDQGFHSVRIIFSSDGDVKTNDNFQLLWHRPTDWFDLHSLVSSSLHHLKSEEKPVAQGGPFTIDGRTTFTVDVLESSPLMYTGESMHQGPGTITESDNPADVFKQRSVGFKGPSNDGSVPQWVKYRLNFNRDVNISAIEMSFAGSTSTSIRMYDRNGEQIAAKGPMDGGNQLSSATLALPDSEGREFFLQIENDYSTHWFLIDEISINLSESASNYYFNPANGNNYQTITVTKGVAWDEARRRAESMLYINAKGHLATITSPNEASFIAENFIKRASLDNYIFGAFFTPGQSSEAEGSWRWVTRERWEYTDWNLGEPNVGNQKRLAEFHDETWNDVLPGKGPIQGRWRGYLVEYENPSNVFEDTPIRNEVFVEGGSYWMGSNKGSHEQKPVHYVTVSSFWVMKTEVTQKDYMTIIGSVPTKFIGDTLPVDSVNWYEAVNYANYLSERDGLILAYTVKGAEVSCDFNAAGWRLPTEAEWEYAARGGTKSKGFIITGSDDASEFTWNGKNSGNMTHAVALKAPNELGIFDMGGNVWEWCWDKYGIFEDKPAINPRGAETGRLRADRGGSFNNSQSYYWPTFRYKNEPNQKAGYLGFRLVRSLAANAKAATQ